MCESPNNKQVLVHPGPYEGNEHTVSQLGPVKPGLHDEHVASEVHEFAAQLDPHVDPEQSEP